MIDTVIVKWYCKHCDAHNRTEIRQTGDAKKSNFHDMCKKCEELHSIHLVVGLAEINPVGEDDEV